MQFVIYLVRLHNLEVTHGTLASCAVLAYRCTAFFVLYEFVDIVEVFFL